MHKVAGANPGGTKNNLNSDGQCSSTRVVQRPTKHIISHIGDDFYGADDPTNSVKH